MLLILSGGLALGFFLVQKEWLLVPSWAAATLFSLGVGAVIFSGAFVKEYGQGQTIAKILIGICGVMAGAGFMEERILTVDILQQNRASSLGFPVLVFCSARGSSSVSGAKSPPRARPLL